MSSRAWWGRGGGVIVCACVLCVNACLHGRIWTVWVFYICWFVEWVISLKRERGYEGLYSTVLLIGHPLLWHIVLVLPLSLLSLEVHDLHLSTVYSHKNAKSQMPGCPMPPMQFLLFTVMNLYQLFFMLVMPTESRSSFVSLICWNSVHRVTTIEWIGSFEAGSWTVDANMTGYV